MLVIGIIFFTILAFLTVLAALYFLHDYSYKPKRACICFACGLCCICITAHLTNTLQLQNQRVYHRIYEDELIRTDTICYKDGSLYDTHFFGELELIEKTENGFYRFYTTHATPEGPRKIQEELSCESETKINPDSNCRQPTVQEFIVHECLIDPEGEICYEITSPKFILTVPPNAIKRIDSLQGS